MNSSISDKTKKIYTIPASVSFVNNLATGLLKETKSTPERLGSYLILLPTRRACRSLQEAFLHQTNGTPIILPKLQAFGDIDAEELSIATTGKIEIDIPPAMPPLKRQILLAHTIAKLPDFTKGVQQDMALARALGQLMDQIHTEGLDLKSLPHLVDRDAFAKHWQITVDFLKILSEHWPNVLKENSAVDLADRRNRLILSLNEHWEKTPPSFPIIAAGSTGSIPSTAKLLKTISMLPKGAVILPGLDQILPCEAWDDIQEGHPQETLKELLSYLEITREEVKLWPHIVTRTDNGKARESLISHVMTPAECTDNWQKTQQSTSEKDKTEQTLKQVKRYDCATPQDEAQLIAILLRETLEDKTKTAALITPDRKLARRVAMTCRRWGIELNDSGGAPLSETPLGTYMRLCAQAALENIKPSSFLSLLKHSHAQGAGFNNYRRAVRALDHDLLRGALPENGFNGLQERFQNYIQDEEGYHKPSPEILELINHLKPIMTPFIEKMTNGLHDFSSLLKEHIHFAEQMASSHKTNANKQSGEENLWQGEEGEATASFLSELLQQATHIPRLNGRDYLAILSQLISTVTIRPRFGTHPRLMILGQLEARLIQADRIILSGLNEGSWPPDPGHDPWMSRPMRKSFGLPAPERSITLAAHDFSQGFCNAEIFLTRAARINGVPSVPARWLQRLDTFLQAINIDPLIIRQETHQQYSTALDKHETTKPIKRPAPKPAIDIRPNKLSVTKIETWLKDPYAIYAQKILRLHKIDPLEKKPDAATRGTILHNILEDFTKKYPRDIPDEARNTFITLARNALEKQGEDITQHSFWMPRIIRLADWLIPHEQKWREKAQFTKAEAEGSLTLKTKLTQPFTITARADRIDKMKSGGSIIIDYKSGGAYSKKKMASGELPQLPLEALILKEGGFTKNGIPPQDVNNIGYWTLTGSNPAGKITALEDPQKVENSIELAEQGLLNLIRVFERKETPYYAIPCLDNPPRFNDYEYLERVKEWAALDENSEETA